MIIDKIFQGLISLVTAVIQLFPTWSLPDGFGASISTISDYVGAFNGFFPVVTLFVCLGVLIAVRFYGSGVAVVVWVYTKFPFKAS